jgi:hypothetical protein
LLSYQEPAPPPPPPSPPPPPPESKPLEPLLQPEDDPVLELTLTGLAADESTVDVNEE